MLIYASCKCCTKRNEIITNYATKDLFKQTPEFRERLFNSLLEHLREIEKACQSQGHYNKVWIKLDNFTNEKRIPTEILNEFLPEKELEILRKEQEEKNKKKQAKEKPSDTKDDKKDANLPKNEEEVIDDGRYDWEPGADDILE